MVKVKLTVTILPDLLKWIDDQVRKGRFGGRSHAVEYSIRKVKELMEKGEITF
jgi:Arc/MetJ-type ribon-helix-helix transcriptional regulator